MIKLINTVSRYLVAIVFIFSGFVKLVDPYGTAYKITDYLETIHFNIPLGLALLASMLLSIAEFTLGMNAFFKSCYQGSTKLLLVFISIFTVITLYIAIADPVQDCGCFGDALLISNWQTFGKNVVLLLMTIELVRNRNYLRNRVCDGNQKTMSFLFILFALLVSVNALRHLPFLDFRPYAVGTHIPEKMLVPEGQPQEVYETTFIYAKDGVEETFTEDNYPWQDTTWTYVDSKSILVSEGAEAPIHDFVIMHSQWDDITEEVLQDENYSFLLIAPYLDKSSLKHKDEMETLMQYCQEKGFRFLVLTASVGEVVDDFTSNFQLPLDVCNMDDITLKTMLRAHPGLMIIKSGTILAKYHHNDLPKFSDSEDVLGTILSQKERRKNQIIVLLLALLMGGLSFKLSCHKDYTK